jgi:hypothetical protein
MNLLLSAFVTLALFTPGVIFAQINQSLINLPIAPQTGAEGFSNYINLLYALSISVAGLLAVIKIIIAGVKYMLTDVVTSKGAAIKEIKGALLGLLLILGAVLILTVINPQLIKSTLEFNPQPMPQVNVTPSVSSTGPAVNSSGQQYAPRFYAGNITTYGDITQSAVTKNGNIFIYNIASLCSGRTGTELSECVDEQADNFGDFCEQNMGRPSGTASQALRCAIPIQYSSEDNFDRNMPVGADHDEWENYCRQWNGVVWEPVGMSSQSLGDQYCVWYSQPTTPTGVSF